MRLQRGGIEYRFVASPATTPWGRRLLSGTPSEGGGYETRAMAIRLKIARTEQEIDDALWVRHEVFVNEDGKFGGKRLPDDRIVDPFDAFPSVENIVAYKDRHPIATMRLAMETPLGLPADRLSDFTPYRKKVRAEYRSGRQRGAGPVFASAGMLAVRGPWRSRRDVIRAMLKIAGGVFRSWGATHILAAVKNETVGMYGRLGFKRLAESERRWVEEVGDYVTPLAAAAEDCYRRAFDDIPKTPLSLFQESFGRLFLRAGETLFHEGDPGYSRVQGECGGSGYLGGDIQSRSDKVSRFAP